MEANVIIRARMEESVGRELFLKLIMRVLLRWVGNPRQRTCNCFVGRIISIGHNKRLGRFALSYLTRIPAHFLFKVPQWELGIIIHQYFRYASQAKAAGLLCRKEGEKRPDYD